MDYTYSHLKEILPITSNVCYEDFFEIFPSLMELQKTPQDKHYHAEGDVWTHTKMVCEALLNSLDYQASNEDEKFILFYAALLHDISKPICTKIEENRITSKGHSKIGAIDTRILLWEKGVPFDIRENICNIVANHQVPFFAFKSNDAISAEFTAHRLSWELPLNLLLTVAKADMQGRHFIDKQDCLNDIELFKILAQEQECLYQPKQFPDSITRMEYFNSPGKISPDFSFHKDIGSSVIVMCGLPASGKDTWCTQNAKDLPILSFDDMINKMGLKHNGNVGKAIHEVIDNAKELLRKKESFIWNATHLSHQMRKKTIDLLFRYNAQINIQYLEVPKKELFSRNSKRDSTLINEKINKMLYKWEVPTKIEGHNIDYLINPNNKRKITNKP